MKRPLLLTLAAALLLLACSAVPAEAGPLRNLAAAAVKVVTAPVKAIQAARSRGEAVEVSCGAPAAVVRVRSAGGCANGVCPTR